MTILYEDIQFILNKPDHFRNFDAAWLQENVPELYALIGREQRADYHPEGDAFTHTLLVIDRALELTDDPIVHFCALTHDFGKAVTIQTKPGSHYNHEILGVPLVREFCHRTETPGYVMDIALTVCKEHLNVHRFLEMKGIKRARFLHRVWGTTYVLAKTCQADAQGRGPTLVDKPYPQAEALRESVEALDKISAWQGHDPTAPLESNVEQAIGKYLEGMFPRQKR